MRPEPGPTTALNRLSGEFVQARTETEFLEEHTRHGLRVYEVVSLIIASVFLGFTIVDFISLGPGLAFTVLALTRAAGAGAVLFARRLMLRSPRKVLVAQRGAAIAVTEAIIYAAALLAAALRPSDAATSAVSIAVVIVAATALVPIPFWTQISIGAATLAGFFVVAVTALDGSFAVVPLVSNLTVALAWAVFIRRTINLDTRRRWLATTRAEMVSARLEAELDTADRLREELQVLATQDPLTGVANRRELLRRTEQLLLDRRGRSDGNGVAMALLDADAFKSINDRFGHATGDAALVALAGAIRASVRPTDVVARIGGEEFAVVFGGLSATAAAETAERIRRSVASAEVPDSSGVALSVSIGLATAVGGDSVERLLSRADAAMYRAKRGGGNRLVLDAAMDRLGLVQPPEMLLDATEGSLVEHITS